LAIPLCPYGQSLLALYLREMKITVCGMGYVGSCTAACFAKLGNLVWCIDTNQKKLDLIKENKSPVKEKNLDDLFHKHGNNLVTVEELALAIDNSDVTFICVGTPPKPNGDMNFKYVENACKEIGKTLKALWKKNHIIVIRSTMFPGSFEKAKSIIKKYAGGMPFHLLTNPEFLREGSAVKDFFNPSMIVVGSETKEMGDVLLKLCYNNISSKKFIVKPEIAEMIKYVNNSWHALKVTFGNEIGSICKGLNIDGKKLMGLFCEDTQLNLSPYYLSPGFAYGGSCFIPGSLIHTKDGMKAIENINIGDEVLAHDKKFHKVTQRFVRMTTQGTFKINPKTLPGFELTGEHPVLAVQGFRTTDKNGKLRNNKITDWTPKWVLAEELKRGDYLVFAIPQEVRRIKELRVPNNIKRSDMLTHKLLKKLKVNKDLMRLLGYYISEGSADKNRITLTFNSKAVKEIKDVQNITKRLNLNCSVNVKKSKSTVTTIRIYSKQFMDFIIQQCSKLAWEKKLHQDLMYLPLNLQKEFIKSSWITDGHMSKVRGDWTWATVSRQLFNQMKILLLRQGIIFNTSISKAHKGKDGVNHREAYYIKISNHIHIKEFNKIMNVEFKLPILKQREHKTSWIDKGYLFYPISSIVKNNYKGKVFNLEVEKCHSYTCEGATVHNCLSKDTQALIKSSDKLKIKTPLLHAIPESNEEHIQRAIKQIEATGKTNIGFLGISFKAGTDDIRNNPILKVMDYLKKGKKKYNIKSWDQYHQTDKIKDVMNQDVIIISRRDKVLVDFVEGWAEICTDTFRNKTIINLQDGTQSEIY
jgi:UDP-glucose 6-dehydrogenase